MTEQTKKDKTSIKEKSGVLTVNENDSCEPASTAREADCSTPEKEPAEKTMSYEQAWKLYLHACRE